MFGLRQLPKASQLLEQQIVSRTPSISTGVTSHTQIYPTTELILTQTRNFSDNASKPATTGGLRGRYFDPNSKRNKIEQLLNKPLEISPPQTNTAAASAVPEQLHGAVEEALTFKNATDQTLSTKRKKLVLKKKKKKAPTSPGAEAAPETSSVGTEDAREMRQKQKEKIEMNGIKTIEENGTVRVERMRPDELLERWLAQFPDKADAELEDTAAIKNSAERQQRLRQHFVLTLVSSLDPSMYPKFVTLFKQLLIRLRKLSLAVINEGKDTATSSSASVGEDEDAMSNVHVTEDSPTPTIVDDLHDKQAIAQRYKFRQDMNKAKLTFFRNAARMFGDKADTLIPMLSKHLSGLTVGMLENARERTSNTDMMSYVASFLREDDIMNILGPLGAEDGPIGAMQASMVYQHIDIENDQHSQYLWSRIDTLEANSYKVFVQNIPAFLTSRELMNAFSRCGKVLGCEIYRTRITDNIADEGVTSSRAAANAAVMNAAASDETMADQLASTILEDKPATAPQKGRLLSHKQLINLLRNSGETRGPDCDPVYGFVYFKTKEAQERALSTAMQIFGMTIADAVIYTQPVETKVCIVISGLRRRMASSDVRNFITESLDGVVPPSALQWVRLPMNGYSNKGFAIVQFDTHEHARLAFRTLNNSLLYWPVQPPSENDNVTNEFTNHSNTHLMPPRILKCNWNEGKMPNYDHMHNMLPFIPDSSFKQMK